MFEFFLTAQAIGIINTFFKEEASEQHFWKINRELYPNLEDSYCFMVDPKKLKDEYIENTEILVVKEEEKRALLKGFALLRKYSPSLPENAHLSERILIAKRLLPSVIFDRNPSKLKCKIIAFNPEK